MIGSWRVVGSLKACLRHCMMYLSILYRFCIIKVNFIENSFFIAIAEDQKNQHNFIIKKKRFYWDEWMKMYIAINPNSKKPLIHMYRWDNNNGGMVEIKKPNIHSLCSKSASWNIIQHCAIG